ncbi:probable WRKY transcription factor 53 [Argentina anserina]|uniref:probable WRKY transcription factor 53 n=1 Tax=Argentina anserina TaxID=57926 RepID=UPI00217635C2|nr:probable WRKY transcription factor 53 [Potentilla anserina]
MAKYYNMGVNWEQKSRLVNELTQGRELARQLQIHLNATSSLNPSTSSQTALAREVLIQKIISSYEKALSLLSFGSSAPISVAVDQQHQQQPTSTVAAPTGVVTIRMANSPPSLNGSPRSEDSDDHKDPSRKRKSLARWTKQVRVTSGMGLEGPLDDGFSWRKYGQKDILGAKYPRGYYRCTHRNVQGCLATKQVQRSDEDPMILEITYRGRHTCTQAASTTVTSPPPKPISPSPEQTPEPPQINQQPHHSMLLSLPEGLRVITEGLDTSHDHRDELAFSSFNNNNYVGSFSPPLTMRIASTSRTNYFSVLSQQDVGRNQDLQSSAAAESHDIISAATSAANSPTVGLDFPFDQANHQILYPNFSFDDPGFFP